MLSIKPCPPTRGRQKGGKERKIYKSNIKTASLVTLLILLLIIIREIKQNIQNQY